MRSVAPMQVARIGQFILAVLLCGLGLVFICCPGASERLLGVLTGLVLLLFGIVKLVGYFSKDLFRLAFQYDLAFGILLVALGAVVLLSPADWLRFVCVAVGVAVLADGLFKIQIALDSRSFGIGKWWIILAVGVLAGAAGLLLLIRPDWGARALAVLLGCAFLADGVLSFVTVAYATKIVRHQRPDCVDVEYWKERKD